MSESFCLTSECEDTRVEGFEHPSLVVLVDVRCRHLDYLAANRPLGYRDVPGRVSGSLDTSPPTPARIEFTGRRPGEKLHEELFTDAELLHATRYEEIVVAREDASPRSARDGRHRCAHRGMRRSAIGPDWAGALTYFSPGSRLSRSDPARRSLEATSEERW